MTWTPPPPGGPAAAAGKTPSTASIRPCCLASCASARDVMEPNPCELAVVGDCHGHLQLALGALARWQQELGCRFEAVFLCGDVGTFTQEGQLDSATRAAGKGQAARRPG